MKTPIFLLAAAIGCGSGAIAQSDITPKNIRATNTVDNLAETHGLSSFDHLYGIPLETGHIRGSAYLHQGFMLTTLTLYDTDKIIEGYRTRYAIDQHAFEIQTRAGMKMLAAEKVKAFVVFDSISNAPHTFVNVRAFTDEQHAASKGFFEVLTEGALTLLGQTGVIIRKPTYNEKLDIGNPDTRIVRKTRYYCTSEGKIRELPTARKKLLPVFGAHAEAIKRFMSVNGLSPDDGAHLKAVFEHYNKLVLTH